MKRTRARRGSATAFVLIMMVTLVTMTLVIVESTASAVQRAKKTEERIRAKYMFDGVSARTLADYRSNSVSFPLSRSVVFGGLSCQMDAAESGGGNQRFLSLYGNVLVRDRTFRFAQKVGLEQPQPFGYALFSETDLVLEERLIAGTANKDGSLYGEKKVEFKRSGNIVHGDVETNQRVEPTSNRVSVNGTLWEYAPRLVSPVARWEDYWNGRSGWRGGGSLNGYAFPAPIFGGNYPLVYVTGDLTVSGVFSGCGTFYVAGKLTIAGDVRHALGGCVAFVVRDDIVFSSEGGVQVDGFYHTPKTIEINDGDGATVKVCGSMVAGKIIAKTALEATNDDRVFSDPAFGRRMRLPGLWP